MPNFCEKKKNLPKNKILKNRFYILYVKLEISQKILILGMKYDQFSVFVTFIILFFSIQYLEIKVLYFFLAEVKSSLGTFPFQKKFFIF